MRNKYLFTLATVLVSSNLFNISLFAQIRNPFVQAATLVNADHSKDQQGISINEMLKNAVEDSSKRTLFTSQYKTPDGQVIALSSSQPVNYYNVQGRLVPIKTELKSDGRGWAAKEQPFPCYLNDDKSTSISVGDGKEVTFNLNGVTGGFAGSPQLLEVTGNVASLKMQENVFKRIAFVPNGIETDYIITDKSFAPKGSEDITISEEVKIPQGTVLIPDSLVGRKAGDDWQGDYILLSAKDHVELARFKVPLVYDKVGRTCIGYYKLQNKAGQLVLQTIVPKDFLAKATYPVTIDPTVMGPVARWKGGSIPSCYYPKFSSDSILVTIPGGITITHFDISYSYFTNVLSHIPLNDGLIYFKTPCDSTPLLSCDTNGLPGTCYIDTLSGLDDFGPNSPYFHSQLTCCFNPSCSVQTFYLSQHLARKNGLPKTCDTNWVWYSVASPFQFYAYIVGQTDQVNSWSVAPTTICSNKCNINLTLTAEYGVPPYTITHPWASGKTTFGTATSCNVSIGTVTIPLTIPGCPTTCGSITSLTVPPPVVYDACGDTVQGIVSKKITVNPVPVLTMSPSSVTVCSGTPVDFTITSCVSPTTINWIGSDKTSGSGGSISDNYTNTGSTPVNITYTVTGSANGCNADTLNPTAVVNPVPAITITHDTTISLGSSVMLNASGGVAYVWQPSENLGCYTCASTQATPTVTTEYLVTVTNSEGCSSIDTVTVDVLQNVITIPNVITPNMDPPNTMFVIKGLEYYPNSTLEIFNRWGDRVYQTKNYQNDWDGDGQSDGVYYYVLTLPNNKKYDGFFQIIK